MKLVLQTPKYLIVIGLAVFLCIAGVTFFTGRFLEKRINTIADFAGTNVYRQKVLVYQYEFGNIFKGTQVAATLFPELRKDISEESLTETLGTVLMSDDKVKKAWYAIIKGKDTSFVYLIRNSASFQKVAMPKYVKNWAKQQFLANDTSNVRGTQTQVSPALHLLTASNTVESERGRLLTGLDVDLMELQRAFASVDVKGQSYAIIVDENGICITSPNEKQIGQQLFKPKQDTLFNQIHPYGRSKHQVVESDFLGMPVTRYYIPNVINGLNWTIIVDVPVIVLEEDFEDIRTYSIYMGLISVSIILGMIWLYQRKWQKEFLLRREVEINRQELLMEKQALQLLAETHEKENAMLQLSKLKEKVNPHFLFNSLSSLNALIAEDTELAKSFVVKLSRVYRYVLESYPSGLAPVAEELRFMKEYFFLLKIRFGDALAPLDIDIEERLFEGEIPFMSLQTLIENAVKHNILSKEKPLKITISSERNTILVSNNLQLRTDVKDSGKQGLNYLQSTYSYFGNQGFNYGIEQEYFKCYLPVLHFTE
ncbi:histidine kinase [Pedobacter sp. N36a]|uniref:histidine kinase n=1 Tax=Pedobacter sp. N36a TaxID=2767996 RepID=UPI001656A4FB|nr:histidine kinase [Pedobacter sp. N36a]MBC8986852.1 histidine kinase [Pedobacter sp. N36a]